MAKTLYFGSALPTAHRGNNNAKLNAAASWWFPIALSEARGTALQTRTVLSLAGPSPGLEYGEPCEFLSEPLAADFTIAGTITCNIWAAEGGMNDNAAVNVVLDKVDGVTGAITQIAKTARVAELALTTRAANNFTVTPTSTAVKRGDRLRARVYIDDAGTMGVNVGANCTFGFGANAAAVDGDSYLTFTENLTFEPLALPSVQLSNTTNVTNSAITGTGQQAIPFTAKGALVSMIFGLSRTSANRNDNIIFDVWSDNAGQPGAFIQNAGSIAASGIPTGSWGPRSIVMAGTVGLIMGQTYWLVARCSDTSNSTDYYQFMCGNPITDWGAYWNGDVNNPTGWVAGPGFTWALQASMTFAPNAYFLLSPVSDVGLGSGALDVQQLSVVPGGGTVSSQTTSVNGPVAAPGTRLTASVVGALEWYTGKLNAGTLGGKAAFNCQASDGDGLSKAALRAEIAVCDGDGSGAVVVGSSCEDPSAFAGGAVSGPAAAAHRVIVCVDDAAIADGQRLRFRLYLDDAPTAPQVAGKTITLNYGGANTLTNAWVQLPVALSEKPRNKTYAWTPADTVTVGDSISPDFTRGVRAYTVTPADTVVLADAFSRQAAYQRAVDGQSTFGQQIITGTSIEAMGNSGGLNALAQSFRYAAPFTIAAAAVYISKQGAPADNITFAIRADNAGKPTGAILGSYTVGFATVTGYPTFTWFALAGTILGLQLAANTTYWLVWTRSGGNDVNNHGYWPVPSVDYTDGNRGRDDGTGTWPSIFSSDYCFRITTAAPAVAVADSASPSVLKSWAVPIADTVQLSDARTLDHQVNLADAIVLADARTFQRGSSRAPADTVLLADARTLQRTSSRTLADPVGLADALSRQRSVARTFADPVALSDSCSPVKQLGAQNYTRFPADTVTVSDTLAASEADAVTIADAVVVSDALAAGRTLSRAVADTVLLTDGRSVAHAVNVADQVVLADARARALTRSTGDQLVVADVFARTVAKARSVADQVVLADAASSAGSNAVTPADVVLLTDARTFQRASQRAPADTVALSDSVSRARALSRSVADSISLADGRARALTRSLADGVGLIDSFSRSIADTLAISDSVAVGDQAEAVAFTDFRTEGPLGVAETPHQTGAAELPGPGRGVAGPPDLATGLLELSAVHGVAEPTHTTGVLEPAGHGAAEPTSRTGAIEL